MQIKDINTIASTKSYNLGTSKGRRILKRSIKTFGCTRPIVVDRYNNVIVGNHTYEAAKEAGIKKVLIIETTGEELVAIRRTDIDIETKKAKEIALVDNLASELNLDYDTDYICQQVNEVWGFDPREWEGHGCLIQELSVEDCIKDGIAAIEKKESLKTAEEGDPKEKYTQLSLF